MYERYLSAIDGQAEEVFGISDAIWDYAETAFGEYRSARMLSGALERHGFTVERGVAGIPTAFIATYGSGKPVIGIQAEFDALDGLSQEAGVPEPKPIPGKKTGHGCGHNLFAGGSFAAALAVQAFLKEHGSGTVKFFGCPAEENGAGKVFMVRAGLYKDVDAVVAWHPVTFHMVRTRPSLAVVMVDYHFSGQAAHAGWAMNGRSALDAAELMNIGVNYLREHMDPRFRIHYAFLDSGGEAPNVVQARTSVRYMIRATDNEAVNTLKKRVDKIAGGAADMTETTVTQKFYSAYSNLVTLKTLQTVADEALQDLPAPQATEEELTFARKLQEYCPLTEEQKEMPPYPEKALPPAPPVDHGGSDDTGDVSWNCPTVQFHIGCWALGTPGHSWQAVAQGKGSFAKKAMLYGGKAVAGTVMRLFDRPETLEAVKAEHWEKTKAGYVCPIPPEVMPKICPEE